MRTDPDPNKIRAILHGDGTVIDPDPRRPQIADSLEMQGGVRGIAFEQFEVFAGHTLEGFRQARIGGPETGGSAMPLHFLQDSFGLLLMSLAHQKIEPSRL